MRRLWLTKCATGRYMFTVLRPVIARVRNTDYKDAYERYGEPMARNTFCENGIKDLLGFTLEPLASRKVSIQVSALD